VIRLEPPYLIALSIMTAMAVLVQGERLGDLLPHLIASAVYGHYLLYGRGSDILPVAWSLEIEAQFYLLAPLLAAVFRLPTSSLRRGALLIAIVTAGGLQSLADFPAHSPMHGWTILSAIHWFLAGFLLAEFQLAGDLGVSPRSMLWDIAGCVAWAALFLVVQQRFHLHVLGPLLTLVAYAAATRSTSTTGFSRRPSAARRSASTQAASWESIRRCRSPCSSRRFSRSAAASSSPSRNPSCRGRSSKPPDESSGSPEKTGRAAQRTASSMSA
jgi:peptidoglycan/LPS O-acetylase OafA/YrhL